MPDDVRDQLALVRSLREQNQALETENRELRGGGGGSGSGNIETRVGRLESGQDALRKDVSDLRVDFARFDERSKHFPTKGFIFSVCLGLLATIGGLVALIVRFLPAA